ncbi:NAD(P)H-dependent oxidoreductase [Mesorhizobium sp. 113-3-3]|uniref:NAD(P)H-dependent oxidoreductase n=1 Tax=Mesorhizobium sp. 113-3-3 TaxID=2744516 RepID=UPI001929640F|nr:NAD(P)H-dependent oxidoreductase [Mesorhizobium sp. 113-3-3]BCG77709.1 NAD(P)H dehydrogenase (quinone) [Mesorhizobium sp. 113-3-3]
MHALIVVAHPNSNSFTHALGRRVAEGISKSDSLHTFEFADLAAEQFDPRFTASDIGVHLRQGPTSDDIAAEQARIDRADALVLVYPVYWWSMPALLKGWIERVFANGWAYDEGAEGRLVKKLQRLPVHLIASAGANQRTYARHGYFGAMKTQIDHGIFDYCGARVVTSELLIQPDAQDLNALLETAERIGRWVFGRQRQDGVTKAA